MMVRNRWLIVLLLALPGLTTATESKDKDKSKDKPAVEALKASEKVKKIYVIKDKYGNITGYTDDPRKGAEEIVIKKSTEYTESGPVAPLSNATAKVVEEKPAYENFAIVSPANEGTVRDNNGNIQIALDIRPALDPEHTIVLLMDGQQVASGRGPIMSLTNVDRGTHKFQAEIRSADGEILETTPLVIVYLHRAIVRKPK